MQARRGELVDVLAGDGLVSVAGGERCGLVTWLVAVEGLAIPGGRRADRLGRADRVGRADRAGRAGGGVAIAEIRAIAVADPARRRGVGRALLLAAEAALHEAGVHQAWLVTTNDNLVALGLYQKAGWRLSQLRAGAIDRLRHSVKPGIPATGHNGIALRDELELTKEL
jgi:ribosomal protein S18 acetylase RimI-like enzyme